MTIAIGIDLGGSRIKVGLAGDDGIIAADTISVDDATRLTPHLPRVEGTIKALLADAKVASCDGIAFGFPGIVRPDGRITKTYLKYDDMPDLDIASWAKHAFGVPVYVENDANLACLGEWKHGAGRGFDDIVMLTLGTGIGSSAIVGGVPLRGTRGEAGNSGGHFVVNVGGRPAIHGLPGAAEAEASGWALPDIIREHPGFESSALARESRLDYATVIELASTGDAVARDVLKRSLDVWSATAINMIHAFGPDCVIIGGGVARAGSAVLEAIDEAVQTHAIAPGRKIKVTAAQQPEYAALLGAHVAVSLANTHRA
ncbi:MAG: ROK family protein [Planctomycetota bacterium]